MVLLRKMMDDIIEVIVWFLGDETMELLLHILFFLNEMKPLQGRPFESTPVKSKSQIIKAYPNNEYQFSHKNVEGEPRHSSWNIVPFSVDVDRMSHKIFSLFASDGNLPGTY